MYVPHVSVDAFVLRRDCSVEHERAAQSFARFMLHPETMALIMMSEDAGADAVPRYLMPATASAYLNLAVSKDPYYTQLERIFRGAVAYPVRGFYEFARRVHRELDAQVNATFVAGMGNRKPPGVERALRLPQNEAADSPTLLRRGGSTA